MIDTWTTFILENKIQALNIEQLSSDSLKHKDAYFLVLKLANCIVFVFTVNLKALVFWNLLVKSLSRLSAGACLWNSWNSKVGFSCNDHHLFCEETIQIYHLKLFKASNGLFNHPIVKRPALELKITRFFVLIADEMICIFRVLNFI